ncbi:Disease resistance response protein, partial [Trema orientale]
MAKTKLGLKQPGDEETLTHLHFYFHDIVSGRHPTAIRVAEAQTTSSSPTSFGIRFARGCAQARTHAFNTTSLDLLWST